MSAIANSLTQSLRARIQNDLGAPVKPGFTTDNLQIWLEASRRTDATVEKVETDEQKILKNRDVTDEGKSKALAALAAKSVDAFAFLGRILSQTETSIRNLQQKLFSPLEHPTDAGVTERLIRELRASEIRGTLEGGNLDSTFLLAVQSGNLETAQALLTAPGGSMVSADTLARAKFEFAKKSDKAGYDRLLTLEFLREHLASLAAHVASWLERMGAQPTAVNKVIGEAE